MDEPLLPFVQRTYRYLVPLQEHRIPLSWSNASNAFAYMAPVAFMSYLVRRRDTKLMRVALLPVILAMAIRGTFGYSNETRPETLLLNWIRGLAGFSAVALSLDCALSDTSRLKVGETANSIPPMFFSNKDYPQFTDTLWPAWLMDLSDVQMSFRGVGWNYGRGVHIPQEYRSLDKSAFLKSNILSYVKGYLVVDTVQAFFRYVPGLGAPHGTTLWNPDFPPLQRYAFATLVHCICGVVIQVGLEMNYNLATLIGVGLFGQSPAAWPPVYGNPWRADSVHDFWARQWHQILRRVFMVLGGIPGQWLAGRVGAVMGTFVASGLFHEFGFYLVNRGVDHRVTAFFAMQGVVILVEKMWFKVTGRRVGGWVGRLWTYAWILAFGQICTDAWLSRGLGHAIFIPLRMSPCEQLLAPLLQRTVIRSRQAYENS